MGINEGKYYLIKNLKNLELYNDNKNIINKDCLSPRLDGNITMNNIKTKKIYYKNDLSPMNNNIETDRSTNNKIYDYNNKTKFINIKEYKTNNPNSSKKKKYRTLLDILKKRQNSESGNQKEDEKEFNKTMLPKKNNVLKIFPIPKKKDINQTKNNNIIIKQNKIRNKFINMKPKKEYNTLNEIKNSEENKETIKGILDTTDNSTFKTLSMNEPNKNIYAFNSIHNEHNNKNGINDYKNWKSKRIANNIELKNNNLFNLYKHKNNKLKILKFKENDNEQICLDDDIQLRNTKNINLNKDNKSIPFFSYLNNNSIKKNNNQIKNNSKNISNNKEKTNIDNNNNLLYSDKTQYKN